MAKITHKMYIQRPDSSFETWVMFLNEADVIELQQHYEYVRGFVAIITLYGRRRR